MKRLLAIGLALLALGFAAAGTWWWMTRIDRLTAAVLAGSYIDRDEWRFLAQHPGDPRIQRAAQAELRRGARNCRWDFRPPEFDLIDPVLTVHPLQASDATELFAKLVGSCNEPRASKWIKVEPRLLVRALLEELIWEGILARIEALRIPVDADLILAVCKVVVYRPEAMAHLERGFPPDGSPFAPLSEDVQRVAPAHDPRISRALEAIVSGWNRASVQGDHVKVFLDVLKRHPLPSPSADAAVLGAVRLASFGRTEQIGLAADAIRGARKEQLSAPLPDPEQEIARQHLRIRLGFGAEAEARTILDALASRWQSPPDDHASRKSDWSFDARASTDTLLALRENALPILDPHLTGAWGAAQVATAACLAHDHHACARVLAAKVRAGKPLPALEEALDTLEKKEDEFALHYAMIGRHVELTSRAANYLAEHSPDSSWVKTMFDNIGARSVSSGEASKYFDALARAGLAPVVASALESKLAEAGGDPRGVFWLVKYLAISHLYGWGSAEQIPTVEKFLRDPTGFEDQRTRYDAKTGRTLEQKVTERRFAQLAQNAIDEMRKRGPR